MTLAQFLPFLLAYLLGGIPFGLLLGFLAGKDIRREGSGNIGATNALRVCGARVGVPALLLDALKGAAPVWLAASGHLPSPEGQDVLWAALAGAAAVLGHFFPVYLRFRGGKGVATSAGVLLALMPVAALAALTVFFLLTAATRFVSVGSTGAALAMLAAQHLLDPDLAPYGTGWPRTALAWFLCLLVLLRHRANYRRLWQGTENRLGASRAPAPPPPPPPGAQTET